MQQARAPVRVLHVDDEPSFTDLVATYLERDDDAFEVLTATSASDGLDTLAESNVDCVVSDYDMPGRNGIEFLEAVRAEHPDLPFILFTGKGSEEIASDAISAGVTDYLQKGSGTDQYTILANRVRNAVQRARAEGLAERNRDHLESLSEAFPDVAFFIDEDGRYVDVHAGNASQLAYDEAEKLVGERFHDVLPEETADRFLDTVEETIRTGEFQRVEYQLEVQAGERWFEARTGPVETTVDGREVVVWVARDVTERKERVRELERYEALTEETTDIITVLGEDGVIQYESPSVERVLGYEPEGLVGEPGFEYVHPDDQTAVAERLAALVNYDGDRTDRIEYRFRAADGSWTWLEGVASSQSDTILDGYVVTSRDVTERKERQQALERANERLKRVGNLVTDDLSDAVEAVVGSLEGLDAPDRDVEQARHAVERVERLVDDLQTTAGRTNHRGPVDTEPVDVAAAARDCWRTLDTGDASLQVDTDHTIRADAAKFDRLLAALFRRAASSTDDVAITSLDDGIAVTPVQNAVLADEGLLGGEATTSAVLASRVVERTIDAHGWSIALEDDDQGATRVEVRGVDLV